MDDDNRNEWEKAAIRRLLTVARQEGRPDPFLAKRRWVRYTLGISLDVTTDPQDPSARWSAVMHNVSGGGIGFWSKRKVPAGASIFVRQYSDDDSSQWIPLHVSHCTIGIQGYLIGAAYEHPESPDNRSLPNAEAQHDPHPPTLIPVKQTVRRWSLRTKCAVAAAMGGCLGATLAYPTSVYLWPDNPGHFVAGVSILLACLAGGLCGWLMMSGEWKFLQAVHKCLRMMTDGSNETILLPEAPCKELNQLREGFVALAVKWHEQGEDERRRRAKLEELNRVKSNILSVVSHDLRTPLTSILLYAQMLTGDLESLAKEDQQQFLGIISSECRRLSNLVDDLLDLQRLEADRARWQVRSQDLTETIRSCAKVFEAMAVSKEIQFTVDCPPSLPEVEADAEKISQALSNLLSNAMKYTPNGGKVHLSAEARAKEILLSVADNGPGIPRDQWDQIFERFIRLSNANDSAISGVGLGLSIVKRIVEHHGGSVWVDSEVGKGSQFFVSLPTKRAAEGHRGQLQPSSTQSQVRVLVCDADPELTAGIAQILRAENYDVRVAHSACRLLAQVTEDDVDVVVTDLLMPDMDAMELVNALNAMPNREFRLVIHSYASDVRMFRHRGVDIFLQRPASKNELIQAVRLAARKPSGPGINVLLVGTDSGPIHAALADAGFMPMHADTLYTASALIRRYPVHVVVISETCLSGQWEDLEKLKVGAEGDIQVVVVTSRPSRKHRQLAEARNVMLAPFTDGAENELVSTIMACRSKLCQEMSR